MSEASSGDTNYFRCVNLACLEGHDRSIMLAAGHNLPFCPFCKTPQTQVAVSDQQQQRFDQQGAAQCKETIAEALIGKDISTNKPVNSQLEDTKTTTQTESEGASLTNDPIGIDTVSI